MSCGLLSSHSLPIPMSGYDEHRTIILQMQSAIKSVFKMVQVQDVGFRHSDGKSLFRAEYISSPISDKNITSLFVVIKGSLIT